VRVSRARTSGPGATATAARGFSAGGGEIGAVKIVAIVLISAGILGLGYGKFS